MVPNSKPPGSEVDVLWEEPVEPEHGSNDSQSELRHRPHTSVPTRVVTKLDPHTIGNQFRSEPDPSPTQLM